MAASMASAPLRVLAAGMGVALASAAFVATFGLSAMLSHQVSDAFDAGRATEVLAKEPDTWQPSANTGLCPVRRSADLAGLSGVVTAGPYEVLKDRRVARRADPRQSIAAPLVGVDEASLHALGVSLTLGRLFDVGHVRRADRVGLIPATLASRLGMATAGQGLLVDGQPLTVIGFFDNVVRRNDVLGAVLIPSTTMSDMFASGVTAGEITCATLVQTAPGAASALASEVALALAPNAPDSLVVVAPPDPTTFRRQLERPVRLLSLALSTAAMAVGAVSIATAIANSVASRAAEIGLRKAMGARPCHVLVQVVGEAAVVGCGGAGLGAYVGMYVVIGIAFTHGWQPIVDPATAGLTCVAGAGVGALAGVIPALRAARMPAVVALRR
jgi:putative ABC transport system permease protein